MKILYKQPSGGGTIPDSLGIRQCYLKKLSVELDRSHVSQKEHHHTGFEIHMIEKGEQSYGLDGKNLSIKAGELILIPPLVRHRSAGSSAETAKYSITFSIAPTSPLGAALSLSAHTCPKETPPGVSELLCRIEKEGLRGGSPADPIVAGSVLVCILRILRLYGIEMAGEDTREEDSRFLLAQQYIRDNVALSLTVSDVASYLGISAKQLTRIFRRETGDAVAAFIRRECCAAAERLLADTRLSLREISEQMHFASEYYFNAFFKKHAGMTPGAYRASVRRN